MDLSAPVEVRHKGAGTSSDALARIVAPFSTVWALGKSTGLGLATANGFVE